MIERARFARASIAMVALGLLASACGSTGNQSSTTSSSASTSAASLAPIHGAYKPRIHPNNFVAGIDNPYFPLVPGTGFHCKGVAENGKTPQTDNMVVTDKTKMVLGVKCTVVRDTVYQRGKPVERTFDWYAQDKAGNVWYMGEDSREIKHGKFMKTSDSWQGAVAGRSPGSSCLAILNPASRTARSTTPATP